MSVLRRAKLRTPDGTESIEYPLGVDAENVEVANRENLSQRLVRIDEDLEKNEEDIAAVSELAGINKQNIGANEIRIDALERRSTSVDKKPYYFNTVADMKAYQKLIEGDMAITLGYYEVNDGGGSEYKIVNGSYTDDGGSYHKLANNLFAELIVINGEINIKSFNDIPTGIKYAITNNIKINDNNEFLDIGTSLNLSNIISGKTLENLHITGGRLVIENTNDFTVKNCTFKDMKTDGIRITSCSSWSVCNCIFSNIGYQQSSSHSQGGALYLRYNRKYKICNNIFEQCKGDGAIFPVYDNDEYEISNNTFLNNLYSAIGAWDVDESSDRNIIKDNYIYGCGLGDFWEGASEEIKASGIGCSSIYSHTATGKHCTTKVVNNIILQSVENAIEGPYPLISNNFIEGTGILPTRTTPSVEGIYLSGDNHDVLIEKNTVKNTATFNIKAYDITINGNIKIINNNFDKWTEFNSCTINGNMIFKNNDNKLRLVGATMPSLEVDNIAEFISFPHATQLTTYNDILNVRSFNDWILSSDDMKNEDGSITLTSVNYVNQTAKFSFYNPFGYNKKLTYLFEFEYVNPEDIADATKYAIDVIATGAKSDLFKININRVKIILTTSEDIPANSLITFTLRYRYRDFSGINTPITIKNPHLTIY